MRKDLQNNVYVLVAFCVALLIAGCSSSNQGTGSPDEPPLGLPLPQTVTGNANSFEEGFKISVSNSTSVEVYVVDNNVNNTLDYYRDNLEGWGEPDYSRDQLKSFTFHRLKFTGDKGAVTIGATNLNGKTYLAIIGNSSQ